MGMLLIYSCKGDSFDLALSLKKIGEGISLHKRDMYILVYTLNSHVCVNGAEKISRLEKCAINV